MWPARIMSEQRLTRRYGALPSLAAIELHEVSVSAERHSLTLRFDLMELPSVLPAEWAGMNTVQVTLVFYGATRISMEVRPLGELSSASMHDGEHASVLHVEGRIDIRAEFDLCVVEAVDAYLSDRSRPARGSRLHSLLLEP